VRQHPAFHIGGGGGDCEKQQGCNRNMPHGIAP
jgi:hypothetical protein